MCFLRLFYNITHVYTANLCFRVRSFLGFTNDRGTGCPDSGHERIDYWRGHGSCESGVAEGIWEKQIERLSVLGICVYVFEKNIYTNTHTHAHCMLFLPTWKF